MAYDKVVDSAALDAAMTYTANRIRNKTGDTDQITWDSAKGFGDAVDAITGGGADHSAEDAIITRSISGAYSNDRITTVGACAFLGCQALTAIDLPNVTQVKRNAFESCPLLQTINLPKVTDLGGWVFTNSAIQQADFPLVTTIGDGCFQKAIYLTSANLPLVTTLPADAFRNSPIQTADFAAVININRTAFTDCLNLETLIIRTPSVCVISDISIALRGSKIASGTGYIYVPDDLVDSYKAATNWVALANQIKPISALEAST
ncbi:MAG: leucine-rich repeat domain-containing protein [Acutalibacteraceae bacterium]|nr:leucine-rich repeat domain-containing protein [Acutalibacteraceae bacterium]